MSGILTPNFYSVIIGTELLNGRRQDAHFAFLNSELLQRGYVQKPVLSSKMILLLWQIFLI